MSWSDLAAVFLLGLAGSGHCIGMCGAFALGVSQGAKGWRENVLRHLSYQLGKGTSYAFLGILLLLITSWLATEVPFHQLQALIGNVVGGSMVLMGVLLVLERRLPLRIERWWKGSAICGAAGALWRSPSLLRNVLLGWVNGFLPCGLSLMALLFLTRNQSVSTTLAGAFVFSAGTFFALFAVGMLGATLSVGVRRWWSRIAGVLLILVGVLTLLRDHPAIHHWFHQLILETPNFPAEGQQHRH